MGCSAIIRSTSPVLVAMPGIVLQSSRVPCPEHARRSASRARFPLSFLVTCSTIGILHVTNRLYPSGFPGSWIVRAKPEKEDCLLFVLSPARFPGGISFLFVEL